jgi:hypothetical protein
MKVETYVKPVKLYNEDLFDWLRPQTLEDRVLTELPYYIRALLYQRLLSLL